MYQQQLLDNKNGDAKVTDNMNAPEDIVSWISCRKQHVQT
jgi:hypothetical protein